MTRNLDEIINKPYTRIFLINEDKSYSAEILEFPGCYAEGDTANEAMENLDEAARSWVESVIESGQDIPEPFMNQGFSGRIALRLPRSLHRRAAELANRDGISLNQFLVSSISEKVGAEDLFISLVEKFEQSISTTAQNIVSVQLSNYTQSDYYFSPFTDMNQNGKYIKILNSSSTEVNQNA